MIAVHLTSWNPFECFFKELIHLGILAVKDVLIEARIISHITQKSFLHCWFFCDPVTWWMMWHDYIQMKLSSHSPQGIECLSIGLDWTKYPWCSLELVTKVNMQPESSDLHSVFLMLNMMKSRCSLSHGCTRHEEMVIYISAWFPFDVGYYLSVICFCLIAQLILQHYTPTWPLLYWSII